MLSASCSEKDEWVEFENSQEETEPLTEEQMEKIAYGCDSYFDDDTTKIETAASEEYMDYLFGKISEVPEPSHLKAGTLNGTKSWVGVIKDGTCGKYDEVVIHYDCEDSSPNSKLSGYVGDWTLEGSKNLVMRFCAVEFQNFPVGGYSYALLRLDSEPIVIERNNYYWTLKVHMDAEDKGDHISRIRKNGVLMSGYSDKNERKPGEKNMYKQFYGPNKIDGNGNLDMELLFMPGNNYYYEQHEIEHFPDLGISYGVFGHCKLYQYEEHGTAYSDDEDKNNANSISLWKYKMNTKDGVCVYKNINDIDSRNIDWNIPHSVNDIVRYGSAGTTFTISKVDPKFYLN